MEVEYRNLFWNFQFHFHSAENVLELKSALRYFKIIESFFFTDLLLNRMKTTKTNCHGHVGCYKLNVLLLSAISIDILDIFVVFEQHFLSSGNFVEKVVVANCII